MNYIDLTQNKTTHCVKHRVVKIVNREGIQGPPGKDGLTPTINPSNGNWMLGDIDTGVQACGRPGKAPYIDAEGYWCIDGESTGIKASVKGDPGQDGYTPYIDNNTYHWFINGEDTGVTALGKDGLTPHIENGTWWIGDVDTGFEVLTRDMIPELLSFENVLCFPTVGNPKNLYVDSSTNELYRWSGMAYKRFETPYDLIDCGNSADAALSQNAGCNCNCGCDCCNP